MQSHSGAHCKTESFNLSNTNCFNRVCKIKTMSNSKEKADFGLRMHEVCEILKIPKVGRQTRLGKVFGRTQTAAANWLKGEKIPDYETCCEICSKANVSYEWLMRGVGAKTNNVYIQSVVKKMEAMQEEEQYRTDQMVSLMHKNPTNDDLPKNDGERLAK
jgi:transcriptional regulator with XRE-family HTH domain